MFALIFAVETMYRCTTPFSILCKISAFGRQDLRTNLASLPYVLVSTHSSMPPFVSWYRNKNGPAFLLLLSFPFAAMLNSDCSCLCCDESIYFPRISMIGVFGSISPVLMRIFPPACGTVVHCCAKLVAAEDAGIRRSELSRGFCDCIFPNACNRARSSGE